MTNLFEIFFPCSSGFAAFSLRRHHGRGVNCDGIPSKAKHQSSSTSTYSPIIRNTSRRHSVTQKGEVDKTTGGFGTRAFGEERAIACARTCTCHSPFHQHTNDKLGTHLCKKCHFFRAIHTQVTVHIHEHAYRVFCFARLTFIVSLVCTGNVCVVMHMGMFI